jgi:hypothetical protein
MHKLGPLSDSVRKFSTLFDQFVGGGRNDHAERLGLKSSRRIAFGISFAKMRRMPPRTIVPVPEMAFRGCEDRF